MNCDRCKKQITVWDSNEVIDPNRLSIQVLCNDCYEFRRKEEE